MKKMDIRVEIDPACAKEEIVIRTKQRTDLIDRIIDAIEQSMNKEPRQVAVDLGGARIFLEKEEIIRVYTENRRIIVATKNGAYETRLPLRELEEMLDKENFIRISRFEIINLNRVRRFDFSISGTIKVVFDDGSTTWVSRRYMAIIQQRLKQSQGQGRTDR